LKLAKIWSGNFFWQAMAAIAHQPWHSGGGAAYLGKVAAILGVEQPFLGWSIEIQAQN
jgi:hypothetical protein